MIDALFEGLAELLTPTSLVYLTLGMMIGLVIGFLPGFGGLATLALLTPAATALDPAEALAFILGAYGAVSFGGSITSILFNVPGTGEQVVTTLDGYPLAKQGKANVALGVSAASSALGGLFGVLVLLLCIPVARQLITYLRPPEVFVLALLAIMLMGVTNAASVTKGVASGALGLMLSFVGLDPVTGVSRLTFGQLELDNGLGITAMTMGLFALTEMFVVYTGGVPIAGGVTVQTRKEKGYRVVDGVLFTLRNWKTMLSCGTIGAASGVIPGAGGTVAMFTAYGWARRRSEDPASFGKGNPLGVLGPEAANNAKEGGSFLPTLAFGIPGSSGMALMIGILFLMGYKPGPDMMANDLDIVFLIAWIIALSNLLASFLGMAMTPLFTRLAFVRPQLIGPGLIALSLMASFVDTRLLMSVGIAVVAGFMGYGLRAFGYSSAGLILGFVLGPLIDRNLNLALQAYGPGFVLRPVTLFLVALGILYVGSSLFGRYRTMRHDREETTR